MGTYYAYPNSYHPSELDAEGISWGVRRDVTSQTMSTTADVVADEEHPDFVTFDLDRVGSVRSVDQVVHHEPSIHGSYHESLHGLNRSFLSSDTLHKTTPV